MAVAAEICFVFSFCSKDDLDVNMACMVWMGMPLSVPYILWTVKIGSQFCSGAFSSHSLSLLHHQC